MYRSPSPFAPEHQYASHQQPYVPNTGAQIAPGSVTYTTSTGPDGRIVYHPFKAVAASYQTPSGIVSGIQWVPAEATQILPAGAQPATSDFAASWNRGHLSKDDQKALSSWQRDEERRRRSEEKESKRFREQGRSDISAEQELRQARDRDLQSGIRERRKSFNAGVGGAPSSSLAFPPQGAAYPPSPYQSYTEPSVTGSQPYGISHNAPYGHDRKASSGAGFSDLNRQFGDMGIRERDYERERKISGISRPRKYSSSEKTAERPRAVSGNYGDKPAAYGTAGAYAPAAGPYSNPRPYPPAASPNMRPSEVSYGPMSNTGYPGSNFTSSPNRGPVDLVARSTTPFGAGAPQVYPPGHVLEGQPIPPRSRATTPIPGMGHSPNMPPQSTMTYSHGSVNFPQPTIGSSSRVGASPRIPNSQFSGEQRQLAAPPGFSRPINAAQPYSPFEPMKIQSMEDFLEYLPKMPMVLVPHDVYPEDWSRFAEDLSMAWSGTLPVPDLNRDGRPPKRSTLAADLVDLWNSAFFVIRGVEIVLYKGRERRTGPMAGAMDLPALDHDDSYSDSSSETEESEPEYDPRVSGPYGRPGYSQAAMSEARRKRHELRAEKRKRRRDRRIRRKERELERNYTLYVTYVPQGGLAATHGGPAMPGGYPGYGVPTNHSHGLGGNY